MKNKRLKRLLADRGRDLIHADFLDAYNQTVFSNITPTITSRINASNHSMSQSLKIPQATKQGYIEIEPGGAFDWSYPTSLTRRGRVQMGGAVSPTITCNPESIYVYEGIFDGSKSR